MGGPKAMASLTSLLASVFTAFALSLPAVAAPARAPRVLDLDNRLVDPFHVPIGTKAIVFLYVSVECPISNRYAPEIRRLHDAFAARGLVFRIVYQSAESPVMILAT